MGLRDTFQGYLSFAKTFPQLLLKANEEATQYGEWKKTQHLYECKQLTGKGSAGFPVYVPKEESVKSREKSCYLCAACFSKGKKHILGFQAAGGSLVRPWCPRCGLTNIPIYLPT